MSLFGENGAADLFGESFGLEPVKQEADPLVTSDHIVRDTLLSDQSVIESISFQDAIRVSQQSAKQQQQQQQQQQQNAIRAALSSNRHSLLQQTLSQPEQQIQVHSLPHHNFGVTLKDEPILHADAFLASTNVSHLSASKHTQLAHHLTAPLSPPLTPPQQEQAKLLIQNQPKIHLQPQATATIVTSPAQQQQQQRAMTTQKIIVQHAPLQTVTQVQPLQQQQQPQQIIINSAPLQQQPQQQQQRQQQLQQQQIQHVVPQQQRTVTSAPPQQQQQQQQPQRVAANLSALNQLTVEQLQVRTERAPCDATLTRCPHSLYFASFTTASYHEMLVI